jgi:carbon monoxide dehydrogenase subunit G
MLTLESKKGIAHGSQEKVFQYLSDFRNFAGMLPVNQIRDLEITGDTLRFSLDGLGTIGLRISARVPNTQLVVSGTEDSAASFSFRFNIEALSERESEISLTLDASLNMFMEMMARGPLQQFADLVIDKLSAIEFQ